MAGAHARTIARCWHEVNPSRESGRVRNKSATILRAWAVENCARNTTKRPKTGQS